MSAEDVWRVVTSVTGRVMVPAALLNNLTREMTSEIDLVARSDQLLCYAREVNDKELCERMFRNSVYANGVWGLIELHLRFLDTYGALAKELIDREKHHGLGSTRVLGQSDRDLTYAVSVCGGIASCDIPAFVKRCVARGGSPDLWPLVMDGVRKLDSRVHASRLHVDVRKCVYNRRWELVEWAYPGEKGDAEDDIIEYLSGRFEEGHHEYTVRDAAYILSRGWVPGQKLRVYLETSLPIHLGYALVNYGIYPAKGGGGMCYRSEGEACVRKATEAICVCCGNINLRSE